MAIPYEKEKLVSEPKPSTLMEITEELFGSLTKANNLKYIVKFNGEDFSPEELENKNSEIKLLESKASRLGEEFIYVALDPQTNVNYGKEADDGLVLRTLVNLNGPEKLKFIKILMDRGAKTYFKYADQQPIFTTLANLSIDKPEKKETEVYKTALETFKLLVSAKDFDLDMPNKIDPRNMRKFTLFETIVKFGNTDVLDFLHEKFGKEELSKYISLENNPENSLPDYFSIIVNTTATDEQKKKVIEWFIDKDINIGLNEAAFKFAENADGLRNTGVANLIRDYLDGKKTVVQKIIEERKPAEEPVEEPKSLGFFKRALNTFLPESLQFKDLPATVPESTKFRKQVSTSLTKGQEKPKEPVRAA